MINVFVCEFLLNIGLYHAMVEDNCTMYSLLNHSFSENLICLRYNQIQAFYTKSAQ